MLGSSLGPPVFWNSHLELPLKLNEGLPNIVLGRSEAGVEAQEGGWKILVLEDPSWY